MLEMTGIRKTFNIGTVNEKQVLKGVDLHIYPGDFITVIGGNGAGKSTLLNIIAGVHKSDGGRLLLDGQDVTYLPEQKRARYLGRVFQDPMMGTAANMSIAENLAMAFRRTRTRGLRWSSGAAEAAQYRQALERLDLGLENRMTTKVGLLSGGQRQALTLLMATLQKPKLLLLDEHTAALDPKTAAKVLALTEEIIDENGLTALMVTHNMRDAIKLGNRLIMMHDGNIIYDVPGEEKRALQVEDLLKKFETAAGEALSNDRMLLTQ